MLHTCIVIVAKLPFGNNPRSRIGAETALHTPHPSTLPIYFFSQRVYPGQQLPQSSPHQTQLTAAYYQTAHLGSYSLLQKRLAQRMRRNHLYLLLLFLLLLLLNFSSTTAYASLFSSSLSFALTQSRSILIIAARTQAANAFFKGLDETKECLQSQAKQNNKQDVSACVVGPLRALAGVYLVRADLNRWFFGNLKQKVRIRKGIRVLGGAIAARWLLTGENSEMIWRALKTVRTSKCYSWMLRRWRRPVEFSKWGANVEKLWRGVSVIYRKILRESEKWEFMKRVEKTMKIIGKGVCKIPVVSADILHRIWGDRWAKLKQTGQQTACKAGKYMM